MKEFIIEETANTPYICFNGVEGSMEISGRAIPDQPDDFWMPVLNWFESYLMNPCDLTTVKINLEYLNITSSKRILFLMYKLNELASMDKDVCVEWFYRSSDEDMYEVGQDYAYMVKLPFIFKEFQDTDITFAS
jgi:hypothetical protein